jgi:hypothetical protein
MSQTPTCMTCGEPLCFDFCTSCDGQGLSLIGLPLQPRKSDSRLIGLEFRPRVIDPVPSSFLTLRKGVLLFVALAAIPIVPLAVSARRSTRSPAGLAMLKSEPPAIEDEAPVHPSISAPAASESQPPPRASEHRSQHSMQLRAVADDTTKPRKAL